MADTRRAHFDSAFISAAHAFSEATNAHGGSSIQPVTFHIPEVGGRDTGWMVGGHPDTTGKRIPETWVGKQLKPYEAAAHMAKTAILTAADPQAYAGSWADPNNDGRIVLDASTRVGGRREARTLGNARNEDAMFGLQHGTDRTLKAGQRKAKRKKLGLE